MYKNAWKNLTKSGDIFPPQTLTKEFQEFNLTKSTQRFSNFMLHAFAGVQRRWFSAIFQFSIEVS